MGLGLAQTDVRKTLKEYIHSSEHPDLQVYRRDLFDPNFLDVWLWRIGEYCRLGNFYRKRILEVGCGFGWDAVGLAIVGDNEVVASDILPSMVEGMTQCLQGMKAKGQPLRVTPLQGDICEVELPSGSFEGIFSTEAIEHVHDLEKMFGNCFRLLKHGGRLIVANDSNRYNEEARNHSWEGWTDRDQSWAHVEWLKTEVRPIEHAQAKPFGVMREDRVRSVAPHLDDDAVAKLRHATAGMIYPEIDRAVERYQLDGQLPTRDEYGWCRNPETGEYSERLLDPFELRRMLIDAGFKVQLRHMFRKMPLRLLNRSISRTLSLHLFKLRPQFVLVATK
ncbi:MAG: class I SAM-dependent methyltransferase [Sphingomonas sp.]|nr:class I SAM-dependent methyltransferase [Sphingomonas sp.]